MTTPKQALSPAEVEQIDALAQEIRRVDGNHSLGAGALAEALWPYVRALRQGGDAVEWVIADLRRALAAASPPLRRQAWG